MTEKSGATIRQLTTGIDRLDLIVGGGIPEFSFNVVMGEPGSGKTTLTHQIIFANATPAQPALYFTVLGEPTLKMLRYQQQFSFLGVSAHARAGRGVAAFRFTQADLNRRRRH